MNLALLPTVDESLYVPGMWKCRTCGFTQHNNVICPAGVYAFATVRTEPCPNEGDVMHPVTWRQLADENQAFAVRFIDERVKLEELCSRQAAVLTALMVQSLACEKAGPPNVIGPGGRCGYAPVTVPLLTVMGLLGDAPAFRELPESVQTRAKEIRAKAYNII